MARAVLRMTAVVCLLESAGVATADDFSLINKVYDGKTVVARSTTLFVDGKVYDFLVEPAETTVFDPVRGRFVLLDQLREVRAEISTEEVSDFCRRLREKA